MNEPPVYYIELNLSNYTDDDVAQLNEWGAWAHERIATLESALPAWRDIETAPNDGTPFLASVIAPECMGEHAGKSYVCIARWWRGNELNSPGWDGGVGGHFTHWQPLPEPPPKGPTR